MNGQAAALERRAKEREPHLTTPCLAVTGGKGGVGKSHVAVNVAWAIAQRGVRVLLVDADLAMANLDVLLRLSPRRTLEHVERGEADLASCRIDVAENLALLPATSGVAELSDLAPERRTALLKDLAQLAREYDLVVIDTAAGIARETRAFLGLADWAFVVTTPEPTSLTDAYALIKAITRDEARAALEVVVNMASSQEEAQRVAHKLAFVAGRFLERRVELAGWIPRDAAVLLATRSQVPLLREAPRSLAACSMRHLADRVLAALGRRA